MRSAGVHLIQRSCKLCFNWFTMGILRRHLALAENRAKLVSLRCVRMAHQIINTRLVSY